MVAFTSYETVVYHDTSVQKPVNRVRLAVPIFILILVAFWGITKVYKYTVTWLQSLSGENPKLDTQYELRKGVVSGYGPSERRPLGQHTSDSCADIHRGYGSSGSTIPHPSHPALRHTNRQTDYETCSESDSIEEYKRQIKMIKKMAILAGEDSRRQSAYLQLSMQVAEFRHDNVARMGR